MTHNLGRRVLITGGAGFLARAIYARAQREQWDIQFTCYSRDDAKHVALQRRFPHVRCVRGDICDKGLLAATALGHDTIIHAAAVKYVDLSEVNVYDTVRVNIEGSRSVIRAAAAAGAQLIAISTDKACEPANLYGATKMVMERLVTDAVRMGLLPRAAVCRYGNVIGSTGSVIPKLLEMGKATGQLNITDPRMTRFWMTPDEAVSVILETASTAVAWPGFTVLPTMWGATMAELGGILGEMAGATINVVGPRPGEKVHESLLSAQEAMRTRGRGEFWYMAPTYAPETAAMVAHEQWEGAMTSNRAPSWPAFPLREAIEEAALV